MHNGRFKSQDVLEDRPGFPYIPSSCFRQSHRTRGAQYQLCSESLLQPLDPFADSRVSHIEPAGGRREAARVNHRNQYRHVAIPVHWLPPFVPLWNRCLENSTNSHFFSHAGECFSRGRHLHLDRRRYWLSR
ncbi:hypothetical protein D3C85_1061720 [compost metagenome]